MAAGVLFDSQEFKKMVRTFVLTSSLSIRKILQELNQILHIGYALVLGVYLLMIWVSLAESKELDIVRDPPCSFNSHCSCSKGSPDLGLVTCRDVHLPRIPEAVNISKAFKLHMENNNLRLLEPFFLQSTGKSVTF